VAYIGWSHLRHWFVCGIGLGVLVRHGFGWFGEALVWVVQCGMGLGGMGVVWVWYWFRKFGVACVEVV